MWVPIPPEAPVTSAFRPAKSRIAVAILTHGRLGDGERRVSAVADEVDGAPLIAVWSDYI